MATYGQCQLLQEKWNTLDAISAEVENMWEKHREAKDALEKKRAAAELCCDPQIRTELWKEVEKRRKRMNKASYAQTKKSNERKKKAQKDKKASNKPFNASNSSIPFHPLRSDLLSLGILRVLRGLSFAPSVCACIGSFFCCFWWISTTKKPHYEFWGYAVDLSFFDANFDVRLDFFQTQSPTTTSQGTSQDNGQSHNKFLQKSYHFLASFFRYRRAPLLSLLSLSFLAVSLTST